MANPNAKRKFKMRDLQGAMSNAHESFEERSECEHTCWDPKDGELCLNRAKTGETMVEARSDSDVQIDSQIWV